MKKTILFLSIISMIFATYCSHGQAGVLDPSFGTNGKAQFYQSNIFISTIKVQQDGKIIGGGNYTDNNNATDFCLARFESNGTLDSTFGINGISIIPITNNPDKLNVITLQQDGKIVLGGYSTGTGTSVTYLSVARCNADGTVDSSFADNGVKVMSLEGTHNEVRAVDIETGSNKIVLGVLAGTLTNQLPGIVRLKENGTYDSSFANNGVYLAANSSLISYPSALKIQPDNKILTMSFRSDSFCVARFTESGILDNTFGSGGVVKTSFGSGTVGSSSAMALQQDGKIVLAGLAGYITSMQSSVGLARYNANGTIDNTFGTGGTVISTWASNYTEAFSVAVQPSDGKVVVSGQTSTNPTTKNNFLVERFNATGSIDNEFGSNGRTTTTFNTQYDDVANSIFVLSDGKILVSGFTLTGPTATLSMARYNSCSISVTNSPANQTVQAGANASFTVSSTSPSAIYQWQVLNGGSWENISNGGQYSGAQTTTLHIANVTAANDQQQFRSIATSGVCSDTSQGATLTVTSGTGINEIAVQTGVKLYPNPATDQFTIEFQHSDYLVDHIRIMDALGRVIKTVNIEGNKTVTIHSETWVEGIYVVEAIPRKGSLVVFQVVKR